MVTALAGCVGTDEDAGTPSEDLEQPTAASFDDGAGAIQGIVVSDEQIPLGDASVRIAAVGLHVRTTPDGLFFLNDLQPAEYSVVADKDGYMPNAIQVSVTEGQATDLVTIPLTPLRALVAYHRTNQFTAEPTGIAFKATPDCVRLDAHPLAKTCGAVTTGCPGGLPAAAAEQCRGLVPDCGYCSNGTRYDADFTPDWQTIIGEVTWEPSSAATGRGFMFDLNSPNITRGPSGSINQLSPYTFQAAGTNAPLAVRVDKAALTDRGIKPEDWNNYPSNTACKAPSEGGKNAYPNCEWFWRVFPTACSLGNCYERFGPDYGASHRNRLEIYLSYFILEPAPADFTALAS